MGEAGASVNYCSHCGASLDPDANYCPQCGTQCREITPVDEPVGTGSNGRRDTTRSDRRDTAGSAGPDTTTGGDDLLAFRRRVQDRLADGWEIEHDYGDSVVLVDRTFGTVWVHIVLLMFTGGVGNLAYAWYCYSYNANRLVGRANGEDYVPDASDYDTRSGSETSVSSSSIGSYILGALLVVMAVAIISGGLLDPTNILLGLVFLAGAAWSLPPMRRRLKNHHSIITFGPTRSTETTAVSAPDTPCVICGSPVTQGVERRYREEYVLAGIPLVTTESGENTYCRDCAVGDIEDVGVSPMTRDPDSGSDSDSGTDPGRTHEEPTPETERR